MTETERFFARAGVRAVELSIVATGLDLLPQNKRRRTLAPRADKVRVETLANADRSIVRYRWAHIQAGHVAYYAATGNLCGTRDEALQQARDYIAEHSLAAEEFGK